MAVLGGGACGRTDRRHPTRRWPRCAAPVVHGSGAGAPGPSIGHGGSAETGGVLHPRDQPAARSRRDRRWCGGDTHRSMVGDRRRTADVRLRSRGGCARRSGADRPATGRRQHRQGAHAGAQRDREGAREGRHTAAHPAPAPRCVGARAPERRCSTTSRSRVACAGACEGGRARDHGASTGPFAERSASAGGSSPQEPGDRDHSRDARRRREGVLPGRVRADRGGGTGAARPKDG